MTSYLPSALILIIAGLFLWRAQRSDVWRSNYEGEKVLAETRLAQLTEARAKIALLQQRPDIAALYEGQRKLLEVLIEHDVHERKIWESLMPLLDRVSVALENSPPDVLAHMIG